ncbi:MAG: flagellar biosynthetic protein FliR [Pirellulaceae bacterium]
MSESVIFSFVLVLARVSAFVGFFPLFGKQQMPAIVKAGFATALTVFWFGTSNVSPGATAPPPLLALMLIAKEAGIGFVLAMLIGFMLVPARIAGSYIGQEIGLSMDPVTGSGIDQSSAMATVFETFAVLLFLGLDLHHLLILILHQSMNEMAGKIDLMNLPTEGLVQILSGLPEKGLLVIAPVGVLSFVVMISLFFLNKAAPTLNLFSIGMPLRVGLGLVGLFIFLPAIWRSVESYFRVMARELEMFLGYF